MRTAVLPLVLVSLLAALPAQATDYFEAGGRKLAYACVGQGQPTIVLESPSGESIGKAYAKVLPELAQRSRVCYYDRSGLGESAAPTPGLRQTARDYAEELDTLLKQVAPEGKLVLVGYSFGSYVTRLYAAAHPQRVAGMLLIDPPHERWIADLKAGMSEQDWGRMAWLLDWYRTKFGHEYWDSQAQMADAALPRNLPLRIISRGLVDNRIGQAGISEAGVKLFNEVHFRYQPEFLKLTDRSSRVIAARSMHLLVDSEPELFLQELDKLLAGGG